MPINAKDPITIPAKTFDKMEIVDVHFSGEIGGDRSGALVLQYFDADKNLGPVEILTVPSMKELIEAGDEDAIAIHKHFLAFVAKRKGA